MFGKTPDGGGGRPIRPATATDTAASAASIEGRGGRERGGGGGGVGTSVGPISLHIFGVELTLSGVKGDLDSNATSNIDFVVSNTFKNSFCISLIIIDEGLELSNDRPQIDMNNYNVNMPTRIGYRIMISSCYNV